MFTAKKSLGQNFLTSVGAINKIVETALSCGGRTSDNKGMTIIEVGPGRGVLTEALLKKFDKVVAVEKDHELISFLQEKFAKEISSGQLKLIEGDILKLKMPNLLNPANLSTERGESEHAKDMYKSTLTSARNSRQCYAPNLLDFAIVANIPYYITGQFLRTWLSIEPKPRYMVLMLQKEVAERIVARDGKESLLSISVKVYGQPRYIETIKRGSFYPIPNVDSAILKITLHLGTKFPNTKQEEAFFALLKAGFAHKRKLLSSNLKKALFFERFNLSEIKGIFEACKIDPRARAEDLSVEDWRCLALSL